MLVALRGSANCVNGPVTVTMSPPPVGGTYQCGQTVTICLTVPAYTQTNSNWIHGITASFGAGWDMSTLTPGAPPATLGGSGGTWGWYNSVTGTSTAGANAGTVGPGFFFDLDNDSNPG
ncbi:MAG TPA: hypothetical protein VHL57_11275, partial [Flavobacteriales bacterium]|nr:hypothetical protein [Flavobacteriales bacterium]